MTASKTRLEIINHEKKLYNLLEAHHKQVFDDFFGVISIHKENWGYEGVKENL